MSSPLRGKYLVRYPGMRMILTFIDTFLLLFKPRPVSINRPKRILLSNAAHLGDVINAMAVLPVLKRAFPGIEIGFIAGSHSKHLLEGVVDFVHIVDHWKLNRSGGGLWRYYTTWRQALAEVKSKHYDVYIDLYYYFGNTILLAAVAAIPVRIGYTSGGMGPLLTHPFDWKLMPWALVDYYKDLLKVLSVDVEDLVPSLTVKQCSLALPSSYVVLHPGTGAAFKEWPLQKWRELAFKLVQSGRFVVLTGRGSRENLGISADKIINYCDQLSWDEFVWVIKHADLLVGVDSVAGHIAGALGVPEVLIYPGINQVKEWVPKNEKLTILQAPVACSPCFRRKGCKAMTCIREVSVDEVAASIII